MEIFYDDHFFESIEASSIILCGECVKDGIEKTARGYYTGDEAMHANQFRRLWDDDEEPYQCENCNKQNEAYEDMDEDE